MESSSGALNSMVILGIDPGLRISGFGIIQKQDSQKAVLVDHGYVSLPSDKPISVRIALFYTFFTEKIKTFNVTAISLETPFLGKNAQNFLKLGYLRGVMYLMAEQFNLSIYEFAPRQIKQALTGFGGAEKEQVARVIAQLFPRLEQQKKYDVTDALAVMLCGLWHGKTSAVRTAI